MNHFKPILYMFVLSLCSTLAVAEETTAISKADSISNEVNYTEDTFFSSRVVNGQSTEGIPQNRLDLRIQHRFGLINQGYSQFFGLDQAYTFFGLEYGIKDWWMVGINRSLIDKTVGGFTKLSLYRQSTGAKTTPLSVSLLLGTSVIGTQYSDPARNNDFSSRVSYITQVLIARKLSTNFSAQLSPIWIHRNLVAVYTDRNDLFALGISARYKLTPVLSLNGEYYPVINPSTYQKQNYNNSLSFGFDIETAGHVFQIVLSNSTDMIEKGFIGDTGGDWLKGGIHL
ncbi:MAG: DUF5777 family beta-barrel protein, partial [Bacteroidota bacterium]|nr:DUF5777 family beta-barrel protein [Bacteroidota bacterium]